MRVTILDYGAGNLHSLSKALAAAGGDVVIETDPARALATDALVLPGVGAFTSATTQLAPHRSAVRDAIVGGLPTLGICLGMQLLFDESDEGPGLGLGVIAGTVVKVRAARVPHMGWNTVESGNGSQSAYFAHSFVCRPRDEQAVVAWTTHDTDRFPAAVRVGATLGVQYHPEKSSRLGLRVLERFLMEAAT